MLNLRYGGVWGGIKLCILLHNDIDFWAISWENQQFGFTTVPHKPACTVTETT